MLLIKAKESKVHNPTTTCILRHQSTTCHAEPSSMWLLPCDSKHTILRCFEETTANTWEQHSHCSALALPPLWSSICTLMCQALGMHYFILKLWRRYYHHFIDENAEVWRCWETCPSMQKRDWKPVIWPLAQALAKSQCTQRPHPRKCSEQYNQCPTTVIRSTHRHAPCGKLEQVLVQE